MPRDSLDSILLAYVTYCCSVHCPFNAVLTLYRAYMILLWLKSTKNLKRYVLTEFIVIIPWSVLYLSVQFAVNNTGFRVYGANLNRIYVLFNNV
jgi:hypothetical protein